jgi:hypothetical protein
MDNNELGLCPKCGAMMRQGFVTRKSLLSWIDPEQFEHFIFPDRDLRGTGLRRLLPGKAEYELAYHCPTCQIYLVDYSRTFSRAEAEGLAHTM